MDLNELNELDGSLKKAIETVLINESKYNSLDQLRDYLCKIMQYHNKLKIETFGLKEFIKTKIQNINDIYEVLGTCKDSKELNDYLQYVRCIPIEKRNMYNIHFTNIFGS